MVNLPSPDAWPHPLVGITMQVLADHLTYKTGAAAKQFPLRSYADVGADKLCVFLKKEKTPVSRQFTL